MFVEADFYTLDFEVFEREKQFCLVRASANWGRLSLDGEEGKNYRIGEVATITTSVWKERKQHITYHLTIV
jgi:hypothetical protein